MRVMERRLEVARGLARVAAVVPAQRSSARVEGDVVAKGVVVDEGAVVVARRRAPEKKVMMVTRILTVRKTHLKRRDGAIANVGCQQVVSLSQQCANVIDLPRH